MKKGKHFDSRGSKQKTVELKNPGGVRNPLGTAVSLEAQQLKQFPEEDQHTLERFSELANKIKLMRKKKGKIFQQRNKELKKLKKELEDRGYTVTKKNGVYNVKLLGVIESLENLLEEMSSMTSILKSLYINESDDETPPPEQVHSGDDSDDSISFEGDFLEVAEGKIEQKDASPNNNTDPDEERALEHARKRFKYDDDREGPSCNL